MPRRRFNLITSIVAAWVAVGFVGGCDKGNQPESDDASNNMAGDGRYKIVCTVGMVADLAREIAGDRATVASIIGASVDPHLYQASRGDIVKLNEADVVFYNGLLLEGKMEDILQKSGGVAVTAEIDKAKLIAPPDTPGHFDPHVWMDVTLWQQAAHAIAAHLSKYDSAHAADYQANLESLLPKLDRLHGYAQKCIATIPKDSRVLVTAHDAFEYFGRAYDIDVRGIQGISTESEAGVRDINALVDVLVKRKIRAVFVESSVSEKNVTALVEGAESRKHALTIGGTLFSDAMGSPGTYEGTYIGMIDHNVTTITRALGGEAQAGGMDGKLATEKE